MISDFRSEVAAWWEVMKSRKGSVVSLSLVMVMMIAAFLLLVAQYQISSAQIAKVTTQVEVLVEVDQDLPDTAYEEIQQEIQKFPMVKGVEYWTQDRSAQYIDQKLLSGYLSFLKKNQLEIAVPPLFRIQLSELSQKKTLEELIRQRFGGRLHIIDSIGEVQPSFAQEFLEGIDHLSQWVRIVMVLQLTTLFAVTAYLINFLVTERTAGFHLRQFLHLAPPYSFLPTLVLSLLLLILLHFISLLFSALLIGSFLTVLSFLLFLALSLMTVIILWTRRYLF